MPAALNQTRFAICSRAHRLLGTFAAGEPIPAVDMTNTVDALNAMTKEWQADGIHVWTEVEGFLVPQAGQVSYSLGPGSTDRFGTGLLTTAVAQSTAQAATVVPLASTAGMLAGDQIGFVGTSGTAWSAVVSVQSTGVTVAAPGLPSALASGTTVVSYHPASSGFRPLRILALRRNSLLSEISIPLTQMARLDYQALPNKRQAGTINSWFYDAQLSTGILNVWQPAVAPVTDLLLFTFMRELSVWANPGDVGDFPGEWVSALAYNLAVEIAPEYDVPAARMQVVAQIAADKKMTVQGFDREPESLLFGVTTEPGYR